MGVEGDAVEDLTEVVEEISRLALLKNMPRTGWLQCNVPLAACESVAEHVFEASLIALFLVKYLKNGGIEVDLGRVLSLSLLHDASEAVTGDLPRIAKKYLGEPDAAALMEENLPLTFKRLQEGCSDGSVELKVVKIADNLSAYLQGVRYAKMGFKRAEVIAFNTLEEAERIALSEADEKVRYALLEFVRGFKKAANSI